MVDDFDTKIDDMENEQDGVLEGAADVDAPASDSAAATANEADAPEEDRIDLGGLLVRSGRCARGRGCGGG